MASADISVASTEGSVASAGIGMASAGGGMPGTGTGMALAWLVQKLVWLMQAPMWLVQPSAWLVQGSVYVPKCGFRATILQTGTPSPCHPRGAGSPAQCSQYAATLSTVHPPGCHSLSHFPETPQLPRDGR